MRLYTRRLIYSSLRVPRIDIWPDRDDVGYGLAAVVR